jgi:DNA-binding CsgD family transcriptional regulator
VSGPAVFEASGRLLERDGELARIDELIGAAAGGSGGLLLIAGPAGIGKTSLLEACGESAARLGMVVLRGRGDELVMDSSFSTVRELLWEVAAPALSGGGGVLDGAARFALPVFEAPVSGRADPDRAAGVLYGLYWLVASLADRGPLALLVDDAHVLDGASRRFLVYLARRVGSLPVLLVVAARREGPDPAGLVALLEEVAEGVLWPAALSEVGSEALVRRELGARADREFCVSCHQATAGNPFYLRALVAAVRAEGGLPSAASVRTLGAGAVGRSVIVQLARVGSDCERLAEGVAVLAPRSPLRHAAALAGLERQRAQAAVLRLCEAGLLLADPGLSFVHPIVPEAIRAELAPSRLAALHLDAARLLFSEAAPAARVAAHLLSAEPFAERWVVDVLRAAATEALARGAPEAAVSYLRRALSEPPAREVRIEVLLELGRAEMMLPLSDDFPALREALALASVPRQRAEIALELVWGLIAVGRYAEIVELLEGVLERAEELDSPFVERVEATLIGGGGAAVAATDRVLARAARHFERAERGEVSDPVMLAALALTSVLAGLPAAQAAALARLALSGGQLLSDFPPGYVGAAGALMWADDLMEAADAWDAGIADAQRRGAVPSFMLMSFWRGLTALRIGEPNVAEDHVGRALELAQELGPGAAQFALMGYGPILLERERVGEAARTLEAVDFGPQLLGLWNGLVLLAERGRVRVASGQLERGVADMLEADRKMAAIGLRLSVQTDWVPAATAALAQLGRREQAIELAHRELEAAVAFGAPRGHGIALSVCGLLDNGSRGLTWLQQGVEMLAGSPARLEHARTLVNLGIGLRTRGVPEQAREPLARALDIAHRSGAVALAAQARAELVASGARPRRAVLHGPDSLTPAELRVARLAANRMSNPEIAQALFVSTKTVEWQLTHAYAKLQIHTRAELAGALAPPEQETSLVAGA